MSISSRAKAVFACVIIAMVTTAALRAGPALGFPLITAYDMDAIGADPHSWTALQDDKGVLYFGARDLLSFDGERWRNFSGARTIRALAWDGYNRLWAGASGDVGWFDRTTTGWKFNSLTPNVPPQHRLFGNVWQVFRDAQGTTFVADNRVLRWDGKEMQVWSMPGERPLWGLKAGNTVFIHHRPTGLYAMASAGPELVVPASVVGDTHILLLEERADGWFAVTTGGLAFLTRTTLQPISGPANEFLRTKAPPNAIPLPDGRIAVAGQRGGIAFIRRDGMLDQVVSVEEGLPTPLLYGVFLDREGSLWATSASHIIRIAVNGRSGLFGAQAGLPSRPYHRITLHDGRVFAGLHDTVYELDPAQNRFSEVAGLRGRMSELRSTPYGLWAAAMNQVLEAHPTTTRVIYSTTHTAFATLPLAPGELLVAEDRKITRVKDGVAVDSANAPDLVLSVARDSRERIWFGTQQKGVFWIEPKGTLAQATPRSPAKELGVAALQGPGVVRTGRNGEIWLLTSNGGWVVGDSLSSAEKIANLPERPLLAASETTKGGDIWLLFEATAGARSIVGRVSTINGKRVWEPHMIEEMEKAGTPRAIAAESVDANRTSVWIGSSQGVLNHVLLDGPLTPVPRPPILTALAHPADNAEPQNIQSSRPLPYNTEDISFELAAPEYSRRAQLRIETWIDGIDHKWLPAGKDSRRTLPGLRDGSYTFRARVVAETGKVSDETRLAFTVLPPWWRTGPAFAGACVLLAGLGAAGYRWRLQSLRKRNLELAQKVRERTEELEAANAAKTEFVANMSHDIRNPLNGIVGMALALEDTRLDGKQTEIVATLRECTTYLSSLVDDVLDFASIEAGKVELRPAPFAPAELLRSVVTTLKGDTAERGARFTVEVNPQVPARLLGDAGRIQQILVNYAANALKYAGGHIRLSAALRPHAPGEVEFAVQDDGPGIGAAEQATLFTKFTRLKGAREGEVAGSGLGLAACRLLADIMGGSVGVSSKAGTGARFFLRLPLAVATEAAEAPLTALPNSAVLLVEDTDYNALAATAVLSRLGLSCERARTGEEALRLFGQKRFNLVLLDRNLPDMDGTEVARRMRAVESDGLQAVLLAVTAYCTAEDRKLCLDAGMDAFVGKPLTPEKLRRVLLNTSRRLLATAPVDIPADLPAAAKEVDTSMLRFLGDDDAEGLDSQIDRFIEVLGEHERELEQAAAARDEDAMVAAAHRIVGQARMIGGGTLGEEAGRLEKASRAHDDAAYGELLQCVVREIRATTAALRLHRSSVPSA